MGAEAHWQKERKMLRKMKRLTTGPSSGLLAIILILTLVASFAAPVLAAESPPSFLFKWGSHGSDNGLFIWPSGVAVSSSGDVYVADSNNNRIQKFTSTGTWQTSWGSGPSSDNGTFNAPYGLAVDSSGNVYVADCGNHRIQKFDSNGTWLTSWGSSGSADGQLQYPYDVAVSSSGDVYVADLTNNRIDKFTSTGTYITKWGSSGSLDGQFQEPKGVAVDASGNVYVADAGNDRIQKFTSTGTFLSKWGSHGTADGEFSNPYTLAVSSSGNIYVADTNNNRIQVFGYPAPVVAPVITSVSPNSGNQGQTLNNVIITGSNFTDATEVSFGDGITVTGFTVDSATQITASITIATDASLGARDVSVTTPAGTGTLTAGFTVTDIPDVVGNYSTKASIKFFDWKCNKGTPVQSGTLHITSQDGHKIEGYFEPGVTIAGWPSPVPVNGYVGPFQRDAKLKIKNKPRLSLVAELGEYCKYPSPTYVTYVINATIKMDKKTELVKSMKCTINGWGEFSTAFDDGSASVGQFEGKFTATPIP
jgi:sugar lactone lactonase YvrE